jgi:hypothetical protein
MRDPSIRSKREMTLWDISPQSGLHIFEEALYVGLQAPDSVYLPIRIEIGTSK